MRSNKNLAKFALLSILIFTLAMGFSYAQRITGSIRGVVMDEKGVLLPGVTVELSSPVLMGGVHSAITGTKGGYRFINLPPGMYKIVFSLDGFQTIEKLEIKISVKGTVTENTIMKQATLKETVTVIGKAPVIDVTNSGSSTTYDKDLLEKIPSGRFSFLDIVKQAPGIITPSAEGSSYYFFLISHGSNAESNSFQLDGLDISSPRLGGAIVRPNQDIFTEVEVSGVGSPAEYGNYTGAIVNVVTKSGGNKFSGSLSYYGQFKGLTGDNNIDPENEFSHTRHKFLDAAFTLGGPILKDKLWFFSSVNFTSDDETGWREDPDYHSAASDDNYFFKLSAQITNAHKLAGVFAYRHSFDVDVPTPLFLPEACNEYKGNVPYWNLMYSWIMSPNAYLELKTSGFIEERLTLPREGMGADLNTPQHYDMATDLWSEGVWWPGERSYSRFQATASLSYFAEDFLGGDHDFKIGIQYNKSRSDIVAGYAGGKEYWDWYGYPYLLYEQEPSYYGGLVNNLGVFFDDAWSIGSRLTVNLGFRYDYSKAEIPAYVEMDGWTKTDIKTPALEDLVVWNILSPRIGFVYQLTSDGKTILKASYRRSQDPMFTGTYEWPGPNASDYWGSYWDGTQWVRWWGAAAEDAWTPPSADLKYPYADMFSIGFQREVFTNFSVGLLGVYKNQKNGIALSNTRGIYELVPMVSPDNGQTYQVYNQLNVGENKYELSNEGGFEQTYKGVTLKVDKRYSNNWLLSSSLTWSRSFGRNASSRTSWSGQNAVIGWGAYNEGKDPNDWINTKGLMQADRTWVFKLQFAYNFPWDILASVNYLAMTGIPFGRNVRVHPDQWTRIIVAEPRSNKFRIDPYSNLDIRVAKAFNLHKSFRFSVMIDVFNLLNKDTILDHTSYDLWSPVYLDPYSIPTPRRAQIGLKLEF